MRFGVSFGSSGFIVKVLGISSIRSSVVCVGNSYIVIDINWVGWINWEVWVWCLVDYNGCYICIFIGIIGVMNSNVVVINICCCRVKFICCWVY